ncbi:hypothetical protein DFH06DRAFT_1300758 [Mycena polygramma]|nr:hypothetical protein DFH06DRAFT_1300758 [Mycena polygramma]
MDPEKAPSFETMTDHGEDSEAACAKIWSVYISEAEKYDKTLMESWRGDMEGQLIFAGLFSASLTAFIIESYKTLTPDSGGTTVALLDQISKQLAASASGTAFEVPLPPVFVVPVTSVICNVLWFLSLGLSLACALIATLVEQWSRDFIQKAEMRPSPVVRARIFSYLYYGLKRFNMHLLVDLVPFLLHMSLVLFFAGLVAFLLPINLTVMAVSAALLGIVVAVYCSISLLPLLYLDCPYRTPLSGVLWRISRIRLFLVSGFAALRPRSLESKHRDVSGTTMVETMVRRATGPSAERETRDHWSISWTLNSLVDDDDLERFIEALPDLVWGPRGRRYKHDHLIRALLDNPDNRLCECILTLMRHSDSGLLPADVEIRRHVSCFRALWSICLVAEHTAPLVLPHHALALQLTERPVSVHLGTEFSNYCPSVNALLAWNALRSFQIDLQDVESEVGNCEADWAAGKPFSTSLIAIRSKLTRIVDASLAYGALEHRDSSDGLIKDMDLVRRLDTPSFLQEVQDSISCWRNFKQSLGDYFSDARHTIFHQFLFASSHSRLSMAPYQFEYTSQMLQADLAPPSPSQLELYKSLLKTRFRPDATGTQPIGHHIKDKILAILLTFAFPTDAPPSAPDFSVIDVLISDFNARENVGDLLRRGDYDTAQIWSGIRDYLTARCPGSSGIEDTLKTIKELCELALTSASDFRYDEHTCTWQLFPGTLADSSFPWFEESILSTTSSLSIEPSPAAASVILMIKTQILIDLGTRVDNLVERLGPVIIPPPPRSGTPIVDTLVQLSALGSIPIPRADWEELTSVLSHSLLVDNEPRLFDCWDVINYENVPGFLCPGLISCFGSKWKCAQLVMITEFLEACSSPLLPYDALGVISMMMIFRILNTPNRQLNILRSPRNYQIRFAESVRNLVEVWDTTPEHAQLCEYVVLDSPILRFWRYGGRRPEDDPTAATIMKQALERYEARAPAGAAREKVKRLVKDLETFLRGTENTIEALPLD